MKNLNPLIYIHILFFFLLSCSSPDLDIYITNAKILDGSGSQAFESNLGIKDNKIVYLSNKKLKPDSSVKVINAAGKILSPGFIDMHSHGNPEKTPEFENFLAMGVTTITLGQDGSSPRTTDLISWQNEVSVNGLGPNIIMFTGHGTIRAMAGIGMETKVTPAQLDSMKSFLSQQLQYSFGLSTGLEYTPGIYAEKEELIELAKTVGENNRMVMSHMRNEDDDAILASIEELTIQGEYCPVQISHIKSVYGKGKDRAQEILDYIANKRASGIDITADIYPYTASYTGISILFPDWSKTEAQFAKVKKKRRKELEKYLYDKVISRNGPEATLLGTAPYAGKTLADLEREWEMSFVDILIDSIGPRGASGAYFVMDEELQETFIKDPLIAFCSDGSPTGFHPRGHGTFVRIIEEFVNNRKVLTLPEAIRKMTGYPAAILGIEDRGTIEIGKIADLVIFDPEKVTEKASYENPHQLAEGFDIVIVNGKIVRENGKLSSNLNGKFLLPEEH